VAADEINSKKAAAEKQAADIKVTKDKQTINSTASYTRSAEVKLKTAEARLKTVQKDAAVQSSEDKKACTLKAAQDSEAASKIMIANKTLVSKTRALKSASEKKVAYAKSQGGQVTTGQAAALKAAANKAAAGKAAALKFAPVEKG